MKYCKLIGLLPKYERSIRNIKKISHDENLAKFLFFPFFYKKMLFTQGKDFIIKKL